MPFLLLVLLALVCLPDPARDWPEPPWLDHPGLSVIFTALAVAGTVLLAYRIARRARVPTADFFARELQLTRYDHSRGRHQWLLFAFFALELIILGWGNAVGQFWQRGGRVLPFAELVILAPFFVSLLLSWACFYDVERAQADDAGAASEPPAVVDTGASFSSNPAVSVRRSRSRRGRWSYVLFQARQKLALVCVPLGLLLIMKELGRLMPQDTWSVWWWPLQIASMAVLLAALIAMPWIVRVALGLKPLPDSPLKSRLVDAARRLRFRCSGFLLWRTRRSMANAMVVGILPWPRYVIFTDRLLEEFAPEEVEAVLGHEVGHVKHGHMPFYLVFLLASLLVPTLAATIFLTPPPTDEIAAREENDAAPDRPPARGEFFALHNHPYLNTVPAVAGTLAYIFLIFGFISRRCERQADLYGCRAVSCPSPECAGHDAGDATRGPPPRVCRTGVEIFVQALEKVALLNDIPRERPGFLQSWQHSTIAKRVVFLRGLLDDPRVEPAFQRRLWFLKAGLLLILGSLLTALVVWRTTTGAA